MKEITCCCCCCVLILFSPFPIGFLILKLTTSNPNYYIQKFNAPDLNLVIGPANTTTPANTLFFDIKIQNTNKDLGIHYNPINLTFYYVPNASDTTTTNFPVLGNYVVPGFNQGINKATNRRGIVETRGMPWEAALELVSNGSTASFKVGLATVVRFKFLGVNGKKHDVVYGALVEVGNTGEKVGDKDIKFKSGGTSLTEGHCRGSSWLGLFAVVIAFVIS